MAETIEKAPPKTDSPEPGTGYLGRTLLVGETVYLRAGEKADAKYSVSLRNALYPVSPERTEEWLKEQLAEERPGSNQRYVIVRKADDVIVGSLRTEAENWVNFWINGSVDPLYGERGQQWEAEALILLIDYLVEERQRPAISLELPVTKSIVIDALLRHGAVQAARFRESWLVDGVYVDRILLQKFNTGWVESVGDPMTTPLERTGTGMPRPVPPKVTPIPVVPKNATMLGKRVYLRPLIPEQDAAEEAKWARKETETFFDIGRHLPSTGGMAHWYRDLEKKELPEWINLAVCLRENDLYIGNVMLITPDYVNKRAETGSWFFRHDYRGNGYGSEAKHLLLEYAFEVLGFHMLHSWVYFPNTRSAAALRKQGYTEAGRACWMYPFEARLSHFVVFDLLREEWRNMPRKEWE